MESIISQIIHLFKLEKWIDIGKVRELVSARFWPILTVLGMILGFLMGMETSFLKSKPALSLQEFEPIYKRELESMQSQTISTSTIVASKNGSKYYFIWCKGANNIKNENKIFFNTEDAAQKRGYKLSGTCK